MLTKSKKIIERYQQLKSDRSQWETHWQDLKELVRPNVIDFNQNSTGGQSNVRRLYDGTSLWANSQFSSGLHSYLTSPIERWFSLRTQIDRPLTHDELLWLEVVADVIFAEYSRPKVKHSQSMHEIYLDLGAFGTAVLYQDYNTAAGHLRFKAFPLANCVISEDQDGNIDSVYREVKWNRAQIENEFGFLPEKVGKDTSPTRKWTIIHATFRRDEVDMSKLNKTNMPYASIWVINETKEMLREDGYREFPYHIPRWEKTDDEMYGRSPAMNCLPDIKMLNNMCKTILKAAQKVVDPPLMVPDDGFLLPIKTAPGSFIYKNAGLQDEIKPLMTGGRIDIGLEMEDRRREVILKCFFVDWMIRNKKNERQTATEISDDRDEMLRQLSPMLGRSQSELLGPMISRSYNILNRVGRLPEAPQSLQNEQLRIIYTSPAAMAQQGSKAVNIQRFLGDIGQIASVMPQIIDIIDPDELATELARHRDVSRKILRSPEAVQKARQAKAEVEAQRAAIGDVREGAAAAKDFSIADKNRGIGA